uniref:Uncharacterized protein n=1 Tax=Fagus sylvatica TaxID=28930 RepID=A0A2N9IZI9_FAGSY
MRNSKGNERLGSEGALSAGLELGQIAEVISGGGRVEDHEDVVFVAVALLLCSMEVRRCASFRSGRRWLQWLRCARRGQRCSNCFGYEMDSIE